MAHHQQVAPLNLDPTFIAALLALGLTTGFLAGLLGIGGGMTMVPFLTYFLGRQGVDGGTAVKMAIATSMATIIFTSLSSVRAHHQRGAVRWDIVRAMVPGILVGSLIAGAGVFALLKGQWLALFFGGFVAYSATKMLRSKPGAITRAMPGRVGQAAAGAGIGFLSGLVGAGGGFVSVPFMTTFGVAMHQAVATSAALGFPVALFSTIAYLIAGIGQPNAMPGALGFLYLPALVILAVCSVTMAPVGARVAHATDVKKLKRAFAFLLFALAAYMLYRGIAG
jgi:uncharacterized protein